MKLPSNRGGLIAIGIVVVLAATLLQHHDWFKWVVVGFLVGAGLALTYIIGALIWDIVVTDSDPY